MKKMFTICAWCFPGLLTINGETVSHTICNSCSEKIKNTLSPQFTRGWQVAYCGNRTNFSDAGLRQKDFIRSASARVFHPASVTVIWQNDSRGNSRKMFA